MTDREILKTVGNYLKVKSFSDANAKEAYNLLEEYISGLTEEKRTLCDFFVRDKRTGNIHKVGDDRHDIINVDEDGEISYINMKAFAGCSGKTRLLDSRYEFVPSEGGIVGGSK